MDISIRKKVRHAASDLQVPRPLVPLEYTGCFVRSIVRRVLAMSTRSSACAGSAYVARGQNGFATPLVGGRGFGSMPAPFDKESEYIAILGACKVYRQTDCLRQHESIS